MEVKDCQFSFQMRTSVHNGTKGTTIRQNPPKDNRKKDKYGEFSLFC